jgi:hypothetical protein
MMAYNRKELVKQIRQEGAEAKRQGKFRESNPYQYMEGFQWFRGYDEESGPDTEETRFCEETCSTCGVVVQGNWRNIHHEWHKKLEEFLAGF